MKKAVRSTVAATVLTSALVFLVPQAASAKQSICKTVEKVLTRATAEHTQPVESVVQSQATL